jgi:predicted GIY-YIG superfamily endonuclease
MKSCLYCNTEFEPKKPKAKFCSDKCRVYFNREDKMDAGFVYCLKNPLNKDEVFYVGKTILPLEKRLTAHLSECTKKTDKKSNLVRQIIEAGETVIIEQLEVIVKDTLRETEKELAEREKFWIEEMAKGSLTNIIHNPANHKKSKTNPIGVRFRREMLDFIKEKVGADTPQQALVFLENFYRQHWEKVSILDALRDNPPTEPEKSDIQKQWEAIKPVLDELKEALAETIPPSRSQSEMGRKSWQKDKENKIAYICKKLINLK